MDSIAARLADLGPAAVFLRFVRELTGRDDLFEVRPGGIVGSGGPARVFVAASHWIFAGDSDTAQALLDGALPDAREVYWVAPGRPEVPDGWVVGTDLVLVGPTAPARTAVRSGHDFPEDRLHPEVAHLVPPPHIRARLPFRFHGVERDGRIVAMCDSTVDDGDVVAIAQVHTVEALRGQGLGTELVRGALAFAHSLGRRTAVWVCDRENVASRALAERCGLELALEVPRISRG